MYHRRCSCSGSACNLLWLVCGRGGQAEHHDERSHGCVPKASAAFVPQARPDRLHAERLDLELPKYACSSDTVNWVGVRSRNGSLLQRSRVRGGSRDAKREMVTERPNEIWLQKRLSRTTRLRNEELYFRLPLYGVNESAPVRLITTGGVYS